MTGDTGLDETVLTIYRRIVAGDQSTSLIADLAVRLAHSGFVRTMAPGAADLASTGGPSSLSTILGPLHLVADGHQVPKLGVPGRPAGGVDVLATVPGYVVTLTPQAVDTTLASCGYAHVTASRWWAPADGALFALRQAHGHQSVPALAVASLIAKKLAMGVRTAGLEGRVGRHGNFGATLTEARQAAATFCEVGTQVDLKTVVILTDATVPYQPYIGRGEAILGTEAALAGDVDPWLGRHTSLCARMAAAVSRAAGRNEPEPDPTPSGLRRIHNRNLLAQGSNPQAWSERVASANAAARTVITARKDGYVHYDLKAVRSFLAGLQPPQAPSADGTSPTFPDTAGIILLIPSEDAVRAGEPVLSVRGIMNPTTAPDSLFAVLPWPAAADNTVLEIIEP